MAPHIHDGDWVTVRCGRPLPGDIVAVRERSRTRIHRYLGPVPGLADGRLSWRLLTCADDTRNCDPLATAESLVGVVDEKTPTNQRIRAAAHWSYEVGRRVVSKVRGASERGTRN